MLTLTIDGNDVSEFTVYDVKLSTGRDDVYSQPDASTLNLEFLGWQAAGRVGDEVVLTDSVDGQIYRGWITDVSAELQEDMSWLSTIDATGALAWLGQVVAGAPPYPIETDSMRVSRIISETSLVGMLAIDTSVEGPMLAGRLGETEPENAADLARQAADSGLGVLWELPTDYFKPLRYTPSKYRTWDEYAYSWGEVESTFAGLEDTMSWRNVDDDVFPTLNRPPAYTLSPGVVYADLTFEQSIGDYALTVTVNYGAMDMEERPPAVEVGSGRPPTESYDTILESQGDAMSYAKTMLDRKQVPSWRLTSATVDVLLLSAGERSNLRAALQVGARITVLIPHGSPVGEMWEGYLEGWDEDITSDEGTLSHTLDLHISDRFLTDPADRWFEIESSIVWSAVSDTLTWKDTKDIPDTMEAVQ